MRHIFLFISALFFCLFTAGPVAASVCAEVQIEVRQEVTMERQAFDAHMRIKNGLTTSALENVNIVVKFADENGVPVLATSDPSQQGGDRKFFIRVDSLSNIDGVNAGTVAPATTADIHWLIIPVPGAATANPGGTLYYVGATLTYTVAGVENVVDVTPDYIFVKPMPRLVLDYFLPQRVFGDDPMRDIGANPDPDPIIPFTLGLRVKNNGYGTAWKMKIDSAQPKIITNDQGLLIDFQIIGSEVNGEDATASLLVNLGDVPPNASSVARWLMTASLTGRFTDFSAWFSHADDLGGEVTSLIDTVNTHYLIHDVLVDRSASDTIRDFLILKDRLPGAYWVYESDSTETAVSFLDQSAADLSLVKVAAAQYRLTMPENPGFVYVSLPDPMNGSLQLKNVVRSDGKVIRPENVWLAKDRAPGETVWHHYLNLFDVAGGGSYSVVYGSADDLPRPPELAPIAAHKVEEGKTLSFTVTATDPNGTAPHISAKFLPVGATLDDHGNGTATFIWPTVSGQTGVYTVNLIADDGDLADAAKVIIRVYPAGDTDMDGMADTWEMANFGSLDRDGSGDFDGDGKSDLEEFLAGTDPVESLNQAPAPPQNLQPADETPSLTPDLVFTNSVDPDNDPLTYNIQVFSDASFDESGGLVTSVTGIAGQIDATSWAVDTPLDDNHRYWWRVQADDGHDVSLWATGSFFVNTVNDAPSSPGVSSPSDASEVADLTPVLEVTNAGDIDNDALTYVFVVYDGDTAVEVARSPAIATQTGGTTSWPVAAPLIDNHDYQWQVIVTDEHGASAVSARASFFVNTANDAPSAPVVAAPVSGGEVRDYTISLTALNSSDPDRDRLGYYFALDTVNTFDSPNFVLSPEITEGAGQTGWQVDGLEENTLYYWRVKANDGLVDSPWAVGSFFVNQKNDPPSTPALVNPADAAWVSDMTPLLQLGTVSDPDRDAISFEFEIYADLALTNPVARGTSVAANWAAASPLTDNQWYWWRARAVDEHGLAGSWMAPVRFFTDANGVNDIPTIILGQPGYDLAVNSGTVAITWDDSDPDSSALIELDYAVDRQGTDAVVIADGISEDADGAADSFTWDLSVVPEGTWYVFAKIDDGNSSSESYAAGSVTVDRTPPRVSADPDGGTFGPPQQVILAADEDCDIYYSLDPAEDPALFRLYQGPLTIAESSATLRYRAVDRAGNTSGVLSRVYVITDTDADDLPDSWEMANFASLDHDGGADGDGDGLSDLLEYRNRTDPNDGDSDHDLMPDGWEVAHGLNPLLDDAAADPDGDGFANIEEYSVLSDPADPASVPKPPVADGGGDLGMDEQTTAVLDGGTSYDPDDAIVAWHWQQTAGPRVQLSDPAVAAPSFTAPDVARDGAEMAFKLTVTDALGLSSSDTVRVTVRWVNVPPVASAGVDQVINEGSIVSLDSTGSHDVDQNIVSRQWRQTAGSPVILNDSTGPRPVFIAPDVGVGGDILSFQLTVTDDQGAFSTDTVRVTVNWVNEPPMADAGTDQDVDEGNTVTLDATGSSDVDDGIVSWRWRQVSGVSVSLNDPGAKTPLFMTPDVGPAGVALVFELTVTDKSGATDTDTVRVTVRWVNVPPMADAGANASVAEGYFVTLDASASTDIDDGIATYAWTQVSGPSVELDDPAAIRPTFETPDVGPDGATLVFRLTVTDKHGLSASSSCEIRVIWSIHSFAVFGNDAVRIGRNVTVSGGDIGAAGVAPPFADHHHRGEKVHHQGDDRDDLHERHHHHYGPTLEFGERSSAADEVSLFGDLVEVHRKSSVCRVYANTLVGRGDVRCENLPMPAAGLDFVMPQPPPVDFGELEIEVDHGGKKILPSGSYDGIEVGHKATLVFSGGIYQVRELKIGNKARILFAAPTVLVVGDELETGESSELGPAAESGISARDIWIYVVRSTRDDNHGHDQDDDHGREHRKLKHGRDDDAGAGQRRCRGEDRRRGYHRYGGRVRAGIGHRSVFSANLYVAGGDVRVRRDAEISGAIIADRVEIADRVNITGRSGF